MPSRCSAQRTVRRSQVKCLAPCDEVILTPCYCAIQHKVRANVHPLTDCNINMGSKPVSSVCEISTVGMLVNMSNNLFTDMHLHELPNAEERLNVLRARDVEIANLAINSQMRSRMNSLEREVSILKSFQDAWVFSRFRGLYFNITRLAKRTRRTLFIKR